MSPDVAGRALHGLQLALRSLHAAPRRRVLLEEAEVELWGLYRRERTALLREAARLAAAADGGERRDRLRAWRAAAAEHAAACRGDGYPQDPLLDRCRRAPLARWPLAELLAAAAAHGAA